MKVLASEVIAIAVVVAELKVRGRRLFGFWLSSGTDVILLGSRVSDCLSIKLPVFVRVPVRVCTS